MIRIYGASKDEKKIIKDVAKATFDYFNQKDIFITEVDIISPEEIKEVNKAERNVDSVTDVLSFPAQDIGGNLPVDKKNFDKGEMEGNKVILGTICICRDRAKEQANEYGHSIEREIGFLTVHGLLHILGFDHIEEKDEIIMRGHQTAILDSIGLGVKGNK